ncbi:MAG: hypothetical protein OXD45_05750 [Rhodobacteraceae bacterium]|nr:hypothetical protein [Paracoccaceae bacterium]
MFPVNGRMASQWPRRRFTGISWHPPGQATGAVRFGPCRCSDTPGKRVPGFQLAMGACTAMDNVVHDNQGVRCRKVQSVARLEQWIFKGKTLYPEKSQKRYHIGTSKAEWLEHLGWKQSAHDSISEEIDQLNLLHLRNENLSKQLEANFRIEQEINHCHADGWYSLFITLTINRSKHDAQAVIQDGNAHKNYIRSLAYRVFLAEGGTASDWRAGKRPPLADLVRFCRVVEHGARGVHHHLHLLVFARTAPQDWKIDPTTTCKGVDVNLN